MPPSKRFFDLIVATLLACALLPVIVVVSIAILILDGRPIFYFSERMRSQSEGFTLIKFRTMKPSHTDAGVTGADKADRITVTGKFLRRTRLDEVPQIWNILRGDISFVGPRPPLRQYVERFPVLYTEVLRSRPGVTGLASIIYHNHEELLLSRCSTAEETDTVYSSVCVPYKAKIDLIYQLNQSICFDLLLMCKTIFRKLPL